MRSLLTRCCTLVEPNDEPTQGAVRPHLLHWFSWLSCIGKESIVVCKQWPLTERVSQTCRTEGIFALYRGFIPAYWRLGPWNIIVSNSSIFIWKRSLDIFRCVSVCEMSQQWLGKLCAQYSDSKCLLSRWLPWQRVQFFVTYERLKVVLWETQDGLVRDSRSYEVTI